MKPFNTYLFIIDLNVTDSDCDSLIKLKTGFMIQLLNRSWHHSSLLVVISQTQHGVGLSTACLTIAHHSTIITLDHTLYDLRGGAIKDIVLSGVV